MHNSRPHSRDGYPNGPQHQEEIWRQQHPQSLEYNNEDWAAVRQLPPSVAAIDSPSWLHGTTHHVHNHMKRNNNTKSWPESYPIPASSHGAAGGDGAAGLVLDARAGGGGPQSSWRHGRTNKQPLTMPSIHHQQHHEYEEESAMPSSDNSNSRHLFSRVIQQSIQGSMGMASSTTTVKPMHQRPQLSMDFDPQLQIHPLPSSQPLALGSGGRPPHDSAPEHYLSFSWIKSLQQQPPTTTDTMLSAPTPTTPTAGQFAQEAPLAGFLHKFGNQIPEFKRRFFVLQPATHLYYFLSPDDVQPRGCLDLQDTWIEDNVSDMDTKFAICWPPSRNQTDPNNPPTQQQHHPTRRVILQAKTREEAQSWIESLKTQRLDVAQARLATALNQTAGYKARLKELNATLEHYKLLELDRDGAVLDAQNCQEQLNRLDRGILQLAQVLQGNMRNFEQELQKQETITTSTPSACSSDREAKSEVTDRDTGQPEPSVSPCVAHVVATQSTSPETVEEKQTATAAVEEPLSGQDLDEDEHSDEKSGKPMTVAQADDEESVPENGDIVPTFHDYSLPAAASTITKGGEWKHSNNNNANNLKSDPKQHSTTSKGETGNLPSNATSTREHGDVENDDKKQRRDEVWREAHGPQERQQREHNGPKNDDSTDDGQGSTGAPGGRKDSASENNHLVENISMTMTQEQLNHIPGNHFSKLLNACLSLETHWKLAVQESSAAVQDLMTAHANLQQTQKRLSKAEHQLLKLWEENCDIRRQLKQKKKEKRVLVQEVKNLQQRLMDQQREQQQQNEATATAAVTTRRLKQPQQHPHSSTVVEKVDLSDDTPMEVEQEKLLNELEEHVVTSIQLHEVIMSRAKSPNSRSKVQSLLPGQRAVAATTENGVDDNRNPELKAIAANHPDRTSLNPGTTEAVKSLFDFEDESDEEDNAGPDYDPDQEGKKGRKEEEHEGLDSGPMTSDTEQGTVSLIHTEMGDDDGTTSVERSATDTTTFRSPHRTASGAENGKVTGRLLSSPIPRRMTGDDGNSTTSSPYRPNPLLLLEDSHSPSSEERKDKNSATKRPLVTSSGQATSALTCPLADVVGRSPSVNYRFDGNTLINELQVYHLAFYSRRIGLQFQKVPPPPTQSRGLLTEAMTADLAGVRVAGGKTAAELRRIATLSNWAKSDESPSSKNGEFLQVALPVDAVLVCGFQGFDDSGANIRPKLGARLVAFDGVSVEVGKWTFESIRKGIQMRGRPITLSFRDDFLTTEQRQILTKASREMEQSISTQPNRPIIQYRDGTAPHSVSTVSVGSHETDLLLEEDSVRSMKSAVHFPYKDSDYDCDDEAISFHSPWAEGRRRQQHYMQHRSFSEADSSVLSAVGPLIANLLSHKHPSNSNNGAPFTPDYMRRPNKSVEDTPQHQDFEAGLL